MIKRQAALCNLFLILFLQTFLLLKSLQRR